MEDEYLLEMLEQAVNDATNCLLHNTVFTPFARILKSDNSVVHLKSEQTEGIDAYQFLSERLKKEVQSEDVKAVLLLQEDQLPSQFKLAIERSIRVHIESKENISEKLGARFLYVPYEKDFETEAIKLFHPKPVAFSHEIFKR